MKKLLFISIALITFLEAEVDLGDDLASGDLISAEVLNSKFNTLNSVVGEIVDADLLGNWECTAYKEISDQDESFEVANGGNGQVGSGYFASNTGTLSLFESDSETSLNSPKSWSITRLDVIGGSGGLSGTYSLLANKLFLFSESEGSSEPFVKAAFFINKLSSTKMSLITDGQMYGRFPNQNIICEILTDSE
tara:strand:+ start:620 stop:1198 length:579 start_codon:yes stop_codon:yes gene_type:complete